MFQIQHKVHSNARIRNAKTERNVNKNADALPRTVDADIVFTGAPYIMYKQFQFDNNFKTYLKGTMQSEYVLRI